MSDFQPAETFEANRQFLLGLAYRLLGRYTEAEDMVQETYLRWHKAEGGIRNPRAYLSRTLTRLCLDHLKSARVRREEYVGPWLPEPVLESQVQPVLRDNGIMDFDGMPDLSYALMLTLERLSPLERAVFILHDVFAVSFSELADMLERTEAACRQLASRARQNVRREKKRFTPSREVLERLLPAFARATATNDTETLSRLLTKDAVFYSDGGGVLPAALRPFSGAESIARFFCGIYQKHPELNATERRIVMLNGEPAMLTVHPDGTTQAFLFSVDEEGLLSAFYVLRNPQKLTHLSILVRSRL